MRPATVFSTVLSGFYCDSGFSQSSSPALLFGKLLCRKRWDFRAGSCGVIGEQIGASRACRGSGILLQSYMSLSPREG